MPREKIQDVDTPGLYTQVSWRRHDEIPDGDAPGHVQVATINTQAHNLLADLLDDARRLLSRVPGQLVAAGDPDSVAWVARLDTHRDELTGWYATHTAETVAELIKVLHKAKRQAFGDGEHRHTLDCVRDVCRVPTSAAEDARSHR